MNKILTTLEWFSAPIFALLVIHMGGHGILALAGDHGDDAHVHEDHNPEESAFEHLIEMALETEVLLGIILLTFFVWLWHLPALARFVPCRHSGCKHTSPWPHILATVAFVLHFFPEAYLRVEAIENSEQILSIAGWLAFGSHFLIDIIVALALSLYWHKISHQIISVSIIILIWITAFVLASKNIEVLHFGSIMYILGAFFLSMFIHWPNHKTSKNHHA